MAEIKLSADLAVDAVEYASRANAILGIRDSGKTYTGTLIAEQLFGASIPFFAFDPIGRWRFLRLPGKGPGAKGFPIVVAGGAAPDLPLTPENAPELIRAAMRSGISMVIDLYSVSLSKKDWRSIVRQCFEVILYENEGHGLRHLFLEEAGEFIPQKVFDTVTYAAIEKTTRMGGNVGVGVTLINPRAEGVNKEVLELCENLLLHRQSGKNSLTSLEKWLNVANVRPPKEITNSLADLPTGQCWAWFKEIGRPQLIEIAAKQSFDANRRDMARVKGAAAAGVDVSAFVAKMKAALAGKPVRPEVPPITEGYVVKGGHNTAPSQIKERPKPPAPMIQKQEPQVDEKEARALRAENSELKRRNDTLERRIAKLESKTVVTGDSSRREVMIADVIEPAANLADIYRKIVDMAQKDPVVLRVLTQRPEIEVAVERKKIQMDGSTVPGRLAILISEGWFDENKTGNAAFDELKRRGASCAKPGVYAQCDKLAEMGFLFKELPAGYRANPAMKVNVVDA